jgi:hypothetical protein
MAKKKATKTVKTASESKFDWLAHFNKAQTRKTIVRLLNACVDEEVKIDTNAKPEQFAEQIISYSPNAWKFLPESLVPDPERRRVLETLNKLAEPDDSKIWYRRDNPFIPPAILALMSRGVKSLDFQYSGGWDETSYDERAPTVDFFPDALPKDEEKRSNSKDWQTVEKFYCDLFDWLKAETEVEAQDILYAFLDDSGAGDGNTYSQMMKIDLEKWSISLHDYEQDEYEDDDEGEE